MKKVLLGSVVVAALLMSGCGGSDSPKKENNTTKPTPSTKDTTPPTISPAVSGKPGEALALSKFATDDKGLKSVNISGTDSDKFKVNDDNTITLPSAEGTYTITIVAVDKSGNQATSDLKVTVKAGDTTPPATDNSAFSIKNINGLDWTPIKPEDDNDTISGRQLQNNASAMCTELGGELPTATQLTTEVANQLRSTDFVKDAPNLFVVWYKDADKGYFFNGKDSNGSEDVPDYAPEDPGTTFYYTCVKPSQAN